MDESENLQGSKEALAPTPAPTPPTPPVPASKPGKHPRPGLIELIVWALARNPHIVFAVEKGADPNRHENRVRVAVAKNHGLKAGALIWCRHRGADYYEHVPPPPKPLVLGPKKTSAP